MNMHITVSATEANRSLSRLLKEVRKGNRVTITSHGEPLATLVPAGSEEEDKTRRDEALRRLERRWASQKHVTVGPWSRDELYERG